ncbi:MAG TPA: hypothetical protein VMM78_18450 [Thermomicrobiales bacterium]|nr:hypothetical protein [Thermomicrobiales bacterium]
MQARTVKNVVTSVVGGLLLALPAVAWGGASDAEAQAGATQQCAPSRLEIALAELDYLLLDEVGAPSDRVELVRSHIDYLLLDEVIAGSDGARDIEPGCA